MSASPWRSVARPSALVFDLDGTLIDSRRDLAAAINRTREDFGLAPLPLDEVVARVGYGAAHLVRQATEEIGAERVDQALERFYRHYREHLLDTTRPYPGVEAMLDRLDGRFPLAVLTNKPAGFSRTVLRGLGLDHHFHELLGGDSLTTRKPDPEGLQEIGHRLDPGGAGGPEALLLIGDSRVDADTARAAGASFALVTWGFAVGDELEELITATRERGGWVLDAPTELLSRLLPGS